jgi:ABC-type molybdenum transport system ATPase subunit/photorepair protein PhrA
MRTAPQPASEWQTYRAPFSLRERNEADEPHTCSFWSLPAASSFFVRRLTVQFRARNAKKSTADERPQRKSKEEWEAEREQQNKQPGKSVGGKDSAGANGKKHGAGASGQTPAERQKEAETAKKEKMSNKQAKRDAEEARRKERDAMFPPSSSDGDSSSESDLTESSERIATAALRASRRSEEAEVLEQAEQARLKEDMRKKRMERQREKERELAEKAERAAQEATQDLAKVLAKVQAGLALTNKERKLHAKHLAEQARAELDAGGDNSDAPGIVDALDDFLVSVEDDVKYQAGEVDVRISRFSVSVGGTRIFDDAALTLAKGQRYGLLGPNGQGKTTLLRLLAARKLPLPAHFKLALVEQEAQATETSVVDEVLAADTTRQQLFEEEERLLARIGAAQGAGGGVEVADLCARLERVEQELVASGADKAEAAVRKIVYGLGFTGEMADSPVSRIYALSLPLPDASTRLHR